MHASFFLLIRPVNVYHHGFKNLHQEVGISFQFLHWVIDLEKGTNNIYIYLKKIKCKRSLVMNLPSGWKLAELLQQFVLPQFERHADRHLGDEPLAGRLGHLLAEAQVDLTDAAAALEEVQRMVRHPVAN